MRFMILAALALTGAAVPAAKPSFTCKGQLTPSEQAICTDPELAAWDRAMAKVYRLTDKSGESPTQIQKNWLTERDTCGPDRACVLSAYRKWPGFDQSIVGVGTDLHREGTDPNDPADLEVMQFYGSWFYFTVEALHIRDAKIGAVNTGSFSGVLEMSNGEATYDEDPGFQYACRFRIARKSNRHWTIDQFDGHAICGGLNVYMAGDYRAPGRVRR